MSESVKTNAGSVVIGNYGATPCVHRLPCGWCPFMSRSCPQLAAAYPTIPTTASVAFGSPGVTTAGITNPADFHVAGGTCSEVKYVRQAESD